MKNLFDQKFWRMSAGFFVVLVLGLIGLVVAGNLTDNSTNQASVSQAIDENN